MNLITPKGEKKMISSFQSRELGLGIGALLTEYMLLNINTNRKDTKYLSSNDSLLIDTTDNKQSLSDDPSLRYFKAGINRTGYCINSHAKVQLKDLVDCLKEIFPQFDFIFEYNQSSGHTKVKGDRLVESNMNVSYGDNVSMMRSGTIGELGTYEAMFSLGTRQSMIFTSSCDGPFWMDTTERISTRIDTVAAGTIPKDKTKAELLVESRKIGVDTTSRRFLKPEMIALCKQHNIPISTTTNNINHG